MIILDEWRQTVTQTGCGGGRGRRAAAVLAMAAEAGGRRRPRPGRRRRTGRGARTAPSAAADAGRRGRGGAGGLTDRAAGRRPVDNCPARSALGHTLACVAGRISDADRERVRDASRIEQVVGEYVALRNAGGGNLKGLCPFHDEKTPSFQVSPGRGYYHCFGCDKGGDVFAFLQEIEHLTYVEAVQRLAERANITLTIIEGGTSTRSERGTRPRLLAANKAAAEFYAAQLTTEGAQTARDVPGRPRLRPGRRRALRLRVRPGRLGQTGQSADRAGVLAGRAVPGRAGPAGPTRSDRSVPPPAAVGDPGRRRRRRRVRRAPAVRRRPAGGQVHQHLRDPAVQEVAGAVRPRPGQTGHLPAAPGRRRRGLHRRHGDAPGRGDHRGGVLRHRLRRRAHQRAAPVPAGRRGDPRRGRLHLRRRLGGAEGRDQGVRIRPAIRREHLRRGRPGRDGPVRAAAGQGRRGGPRAGREPQPALRFRHHHHAEAVQPGHRGGPGRGHQRHRSRWSPGSRRRRCGTSTSGSWPGGSAPSSRRSAAGSGSSRPPPRERRNARPPGIGGAARWSRPSRRRGHRNGGPPDRPTACHGAPRAGDDHEPPPEPPEPPDDEAGTAGRSGPGRPPAASFHRPHPKNPALRVEREALQLALQHPDLVVAGYPHVSEEAYTDPTYAAVHRAIAAAGGPPGDGSKAAWVDTVAEQLPAGAFRSLVTELAVEPPPVPPGRGERPVRRRHPGQDGRTGRGRRRAEPAVGDAAGGGVGGLRAGAATARRPGRGRQLPSCARRPGQG